MLGRGLTRLHAMTRHNNAMRIFAFCNAKFLTDLQPGKVQAAIAELRNPKARPAKAGKPPEMTKGASLQTCNHSIKAVKSFTHWASRDGRMQADPLAHLTKFNARTDRRHDRRALSDAEVNALVAAAEAGPTILGISGPARAMLYRVAVGTGFRKAEIESLTPECFRLDDTPPTITVKAGFSKHRREDVQPIRQDLADALRGYLAGLAAGQPAFAMPDKTFKVIQADLAAAGIPYDDAAGRYADFHALRHTYITRLVKSNATVKVCHELARHSDPKLTFGVYSHVGMADTSPALDNLPGLDKPQAGRQSALALRTGTDNRPVNAVELPGQASGNCMARNGALLCTETKSPDGAVIAQGNNQQTP